MQIDILNRITRYCYYFNDENAVDSLKVSYLKNKQELEKTTCILAGIEHDSSKTWGEDGYYLGDKVEIKNVCYTGKTKISGRVKFHDLNLTRVKEFISQPYWLVLGCYNATSANSGLCEVIFGFLMDEAIVKVLSDKIVKGEPDPEIALQDYQHVFSNGAVNFFYRDPTLDPRAYTKKLYNLLQGDLFYTPSPPLKHSQVNNFDLIYGFLKDKTLLENEFYSIEIMKRRKENPNLPVGSLFLKSYEIFSIDELSLYQQEIVDLCTQHNARAYINLSKKNLKKIALQTMSKTAQSIESDNLHVKKIYNKCLHRNHVGKPYLVIDVDWEDVILEGMSSVEVAAEIKVKAQQGLELSKVEDKTVLEVPTKNGLHFICMPFKLDSFQESYPKIKVHRNALTLLFIP